MRSRFSAGTVESAVKVLGAASWSARPRLIGRCVVKKTPAGRPSGPEPLCSRPRPPPIFASPTAPPLPCEMRSASDNGPRVKGAAACFITPSVCASANAAASLALRRSWCFELKRLIKLVCRGALRRLCVDCACPRSNVTSVC